MTVTATKTHQAAKRCHHQHPQNSATRQQSFKPSPSQPVGVHHPRSKGLGTACSSPPTPECRVNRYYNTATATFLTVDPDLAQTMQPYAYADGNPLVNSDTNGLSVNLAGVAAWARKNATVLDSDGYNQDDCTDFASRALHSGGGDPETSRYGGIAPFNRKDDNNWYQSWYPFEGSVASYSWGDANALAQHLRDNGSSWVVNDASSTTFTCPGSGLGKVRPGDIVFSDWHGPQLQMNHTGVIVGTSGGQITLAQHSTAADHQNETMPISKWFSYNVNTHIWIVSPAQG